MRDRTSQAKPNTRTDGAPIAREFRALRLDANRTTDGAYNVLVTYRTGGEAAGLSFTEANRDAYKARYRYIAQRDLDGATAETIAAEVYLLFDAVQALAGAEVA